MLFLPPLSPHSPSSVDARLKGSPSCSSSLLLWAMSPTPWASSCTVCSQSLCCRSSPGSLGGTCVCISMYRYVVCACMCVVRVCACVCESMCVDLRLCYKATQIPTTLSPRTSRHDCYIPLHPLGSHTLYCNSIAKSNSI